MPASRSCTGSASGSSAATCSIPYEVPQPRLFSFNNPFGACPICHGFGNIIELDMDLVVPDATKSIQQNAIEPWSKPHYRAQLAELKRVARKRGSASTCRGRSSTDDEKRFVIEGDGGGCEGVQGLLPLARAQEVQGARPRVPEPLPRLPDLPRVRRRAAAPRGARRAASASAPSTWSAALTVRGRGRFFDDAARCRRRTRSIADKVLREIRKRLGFLRDVGLDYLTLDRLSSTLSGGESQRINLATSLGSALVDTLYVLDEPSIGLHSRDNERLIDDPAQAARPGQHRARRRARRRHDPRRRHVVDMGLGAGEQGGRVIFSGTLDGADAGAALADGEVPARRAGDPGAGDAPRGRPTRGSDVLGAAEHNLKDIDVEIPLGMLTCVTGVSGSGKSTLVHDVLYAALKRAKGDWDRRVGTHRKLEGAEFVTDVVLVDQAPIGRTPRSNPVTYLKAFDPIRELFASTKDAQGARPDRQPLLLQRAGRPLRGVRGRRRGQGRDAVPRRRVRAVRVSATASASSRRCSRSSTAAANIDQVLDMTVREALTFFSSSPKVLRRLQVLDEIGLGYLRLGQPATTLSGGEAQRIKIAAHLSSQTGDRMLYILDEPTTGLHFDDIAKLLAAFRKLLEAGHSLLVIEHNLDVIKTADWIIDLGPEGGEEGGQVVAAGTPEQVAQVAASHTGRYLARRARRRPLERLRELSAARTLTVDGRRRVAVR